MKYLYTILLAVLTLPVGAQTVTVKTGQVTYVYDGFNVGDMPFTTNGTTLTIGGKTFNVADVTNILVDFSSVKDDVVDVKYNGSTASVVVSGNIARYLTVTASGADVSVVQDPLLQSEVTYTLSGSSSNGSFTTSGDFKNTINLSNLTLTSTNGPAINILNGKANHMNIAGENTLSDAAGGTHTATLYFDGHPTIAGTGTLTLHGLTKHALATDEYFHLTGGTINVAQAAGDGFHVNERFQMDGGKVNITAVGDGIDVEFRGVNKGTKDLYAKNGFIELNGGVLTVSTAGTATKAIKADSTIVLAGATVTATTSGNSTYDAVKKDTSSPSAVKAGGAFNMTSGTLTATSTGTGGKGINATDDVTISGGIAYVTTTGSLYQYSDKLDTKPNGIKTDANIIISGGSVYVCAGNNDSKSTSFKPGNDGVFLINGGNVMGVSVKKPTVSTSSKQASKNYTKVNVVGGQTLSYDGLEYTVPSIYNNSSANVVVSKGATSVFSGAPRRF